MSLLKKLYGLLNELSPAIKALFKTGDVPTEDSFKRLIDYIRAPHLLLGLEKADGSEGTGLGAGLTLDKENKLTVDTAVTDLTAGDGIAVSDRVVSAKFKSGGGLGLEGDKLIVDPEVTKLSAGDGITVSDRTVSVKVLPGGGLGLHEGKLHVDPAVTEFKGGPGVIVENKVVSLNLQLGRGLEVRDGYLRVSPFDYQKLFGVYMHSANYYCHVGGNGVFLFEGPKYVVARIYTIKANYLFPDLDAYKLDGREAIDIPAGAGFVVFEGRVAEGMKFVLKFGDYGTSVIREIEGAVVSTVPG
jgi:hypothetical protein